MTFSKTFAAAALLAGAVLAAPASAASLGLTIDPTISISGSAQAENDPSFIGFNVTSTGGLAGAGFGGDPAPLDLSLFDFAAGPVPGGAEFAVSDVAPVLTSAALIATAASSDAAVDGDDVIELLFGSLGGSAAGAFGERALVTLVGEFGEDPFGIGFAFTPVAFSANPVTTPAPIPLPAGLPLILTGLGALGALRLAGRRRS
jgi:hypothetical protein